MTSNADEPRLISHHTFPPGVWVTVAEVADPAWVVTGPARTAVPGPTMSAQVLHKNTGSITLAVYEDGAVRYDGPNEDYPADGWRWRMIPTSDIRMDDTDPAPGNPLTGHRLEGAGMDAATRARYEAGVEAGYMRRAGLTTEGDYVYEITAEGKRAAMELLAEEIRSAGH